MYIVSKTTGEIVVLSGKYGSSEPDKETAVKQASEVSGVPENQLLYFHVGDETDTAQNLFDGYSFSVVINNGEITGVDFSSELAKPKLFFTCSDTLIIDNGSDSTVVSIVAKKEDGTIDTTVNGNVPIPVRTSTGAKALKMFVFSSGQSSESIKGIVAGTILVPCYPNRFDGFRVGSSVTIEVAMG